MISKAKVVAHGANAIRYAGEKDKAELVKVNNLPDDITPSAMWARMLALQKQFEGKLGRGHPMKNNSIRIEVSPTKAETEGWTMDDWRKLADDYIREFDAIDLSQRAKRKSAKATNLQHSQYVVMLHHDSRSGIPHLHINANRIDMKGNVNDGHFIYERAMIAASRIARQRGWVDAQVVSQDNKDAITKACREVLLSMPCFGWKAYKDGLAAKGYAVELTTDNKGVVRGYTIGKGNSIYKSSEIGKGRVFMPSKIEATWARLHHVTGTKENILLVSQNGDKRSKLVTSSHISRKESVAVEPPQIHHFDFSTDEFHRYPVDIPERALETIKAHATLPDDNVFATVADVQRTALLLFAGYIDAATTVAVHSGGGGSNQTSGWGRDKDEDDMDWARRCAVMARQLCAPRKKRGLGR